MVEQRHADRIVIVGGGPAAAAAAVALRDAGHLGGLTMVCGESADPYSRPPLSKAFFKGDVERTDLSLGVADAEVRSGVRALSVDVERRLVSTSDGDRLPYDGLIVATGSRPRRPSHLSEVLTVSTIEDAALLRDRLQAVNSIVIVGSGFLAYEIASAARAKGLAVIMVIRAGALETKIGCLAPLLRRGALDNGVKLVESRGGALEPGRVATPEGADHEADLLFAALGTETDTALLPAYAVSGQGYLVDEYCRVAPGIVAAGDAAVTRGPDGALSREVTWTNALEQGAAAARLLIGASSSPYVSTRYGWTEAFGLDIKTVGAIPSTGTPEIIDGDLHSGSALVRWNENAVAAVGYRIPVGKLKGLVAAPAVLAGERN